MTNEEAFREFIIAYMNQCRIETGSIVDPVAISQPFSESTFNLSDKVMIEITEAAALSLGLRPLMN